MQTLKYKREIVKLDDICENQKLLTEKFSRDRKLYQFTLKNIKNYYCTNGFISDFHFHMKWMIFSI